MCREPAIQISTLLRKESGVVEVALPVLDVDLSVGDVQVTQNQYMPLTSLGARSQLAQARVHLLKEDPLLILSGGSHLAGMHVRRHHRQGAEGRLQIHLQPSSRPIQCWVPHLLTHIKGLMSTENRHTSASQLRSR